MALDTLLILSNLELKQIFHGKMHPVAERAEIEFKEPFEKGDCKLVYVMGKNKYGRIVFSTKGKKEGRKYFAGGVGSNLGVCDINDLKTYRPLQYKK